MRSICLLLVFSVCLVSRVTAEEITLTNLDDTFINGSLILGNNDDTHGGESVFSASRNSHLWSDSLVRANDIFGNSPGQLAPDVTIHSATLHVWLDISWGVTGNTYSLYQLQREWDEATVSSNSFGGRVEGQSTGAPVATLAGPIANPYTTDTEFVFDVTASLLAWQAGSTNFGWGLTATSARNEFFSAEHSDATRHPVVQVNYTAVPEPPAALAMGVGGFGIVLIRRRRSR